MTGRWSFQIRDNTRAITIYGTNAEIATALTGFGVSGVNTNFDVGDIIGISGQTDLVDGALVLTAGGIGGFAVSGRTATAPLFAGTLLISPSDVGASNDSRLEPTVGCVSQPSSVPCR